MYTGKGTHASTQQIMVKITFPAAASSANYAQAPSCARPQVDWRLAHLTTHHTEKIAMIHGFHGNTNDTIYHVSI